ncbi:MAG: hypothetical protein U0931_13990 [Vulcanimicrobiota bacterium]
MRSKRGLTMLEALITVLITGMLVQTAASLFQSYIREGRQRRSQQQSLLAIAVGLERLTHEAESAEEILQTGNELKFRRLDPDHPRFPRVTTLDLSAASDRLEIHYFLDQDRLLRISRNAQGVTGSDLVAEGVRSLQVVRRQNHLEISLQPQTGGRPVVSAARLRIL